MSEIKNLLNVVYHSDDDTGMNYVGEIDFGIHSSNLAEYVKRYGLKGVDEILANLGHLAYEVKKIFYENMSPTINQCEEVSKKDL
jgi:hypothetical protein